MRRLRLLLVVLAACNDPAPQQPANPAIPSPSSTSEPPRLPPLDGAAADEAVAAIANLKPDAPHLAVLAASALAELEANRLPAPMLLFFTGFAADPADRATTLSAPLSDLLIAPWVAKACPDHQAVLQRHRDSPPAAVAAAVWTDCRMQDLGLVTPEHAAASDPLSLFAAHVPYVYLQAHGGADPRERTLLRHLVGPRE